MYESHVISITVAQLLPHSDIVNEAEVQKTYKVEDLNPKWFTIDAGTKCVICPKLGPRAMPGARKCTICNTELGRQGHTWRHGAKHFGAVVCTNWEGLCHLCSRFVQRGGCPSTSQDTINKSKEVEWTLGTTRQVLNRQLFSSGQDLQIVIVFIHSHAYCHCRCILSSITYIHTYILTCEL